MQEEREREGENVCVRAWEGERERKREAGKLNERWRLW